MVYHSDVARRPMTDWCGVKLRPAAWAGVVAVLTVAAVGCDDPLLPRSMQVFVAGTVTSPGNVPVPNASVVLEIFRAVDSVRVGEEPTVANANGRYGIFLAVFAPEPFDGLLAARAAAAPAAGSTLEGEVLNVPIRFKPREDGIDTVIVDIALQEVSSR